MTDNLQSKIANIYNFDKMILHLMSMIWYFHGLVWTIVKNLAHFSQEDQINLISSYDHF